MTSLPRSRTQLIPPREMCGSRQSATSNGGSFSRTLRLVHSSAVYGRRLRKRESDIQVFGFGLRGLILENRAVRTARPLTASCHRECLRRLLGNILHVRRVHCAWKLRVCRRKAWNREYARSRPLFVGEYFDHITSENLIVRQPRRVRTYK